MTNTTVFRASVAVIAGIMVSAAPSTGHAKAAPASRAFVARDSTPAARVAFRQGRAAFDAHKFEDAAAQFERAVALDPSFAEGYRWLGNAYIQQALAGSMFAKVKLGPRARDAWERAAALDPRDVDARENLCTYYDQAPGFLGGDPAKAAAMVDAIRALDPYRGGVLTGQLAQRRKDYGAAAAAFGAAARTSADTSDVAFQGWVAALSEQKRFDDAFAAVDEHLRRAPNDPIALYHLGRVAGLSGQRTADGLTALDRGMQMPIPPTFPYRKSAFHYWRGVLLEHAGRTDSAVVEYRTVLTMDGQHPQAEAALKRLGS